MASVYFRVGQFTYWFKSIVSVVARIFQFGCYEHEN